MNIYKRQGNLIRQDQLYFPILLIGAGGIGSWVGVALAKMGCSNIMLVDFDKVEPHNIPSQSYEIRDRDRPKVYALEQAMNEMNHEKNKIYESFKKSFEDFFKDHIRKISVIICALDSMDERIKLWDIIKARDDVDLFIDARMGGELLRVYAVDPLNNEHVKFYESKLYPSSKADPLPCGSRSIVYTTLFAGAVVSSYVKKYARGEDIKAEVIMDFSTMSLV